MIVRPLVAASRTSSSRWIIERDLERWREIRPLAAAAADTATVDDAICTYLVTYAEFRNVFYYRLEHGGGIHLLLVKLARRIWWPVPSFEMSCGDIGPGFVARHGYSSILTAERIGANCFVHHEVTIGWDTGERAPRIGNDVFIGAGAKILGPVTIGDGVRIGANAVVLRDVPDGCTAVGVPARIIEPKGPPPARLRDSSS
jgi:serine O-acetyltransferase